MAIFAIKGWITLFIRSNPGKARTCTSINSVVSSLGKLAGVGLSVENGPEFDSSRILQKES